eukprot:729641-Amphidinium_carterae.1
MKSCMGTMGRDLVCHFGGLCRRSRAASSRFASCWDGCRKLGKVPVRACESKPSHWEGRHDEECGGVKA